MQTDGFVSIAEDSVLHVGCHSTACFV
jgi:hypothetical protein